MSGRLKSQETRKLMSIHAQCEEQRERMRKIGLSNAGRPSNRLGVKLSPETRLKISLNSSRHTKNRKFSTEQELEICESTKSKKIIDIAKTYNVHYSTIYDILKRNGIKRTPQYNRKISISDAMKIIELKKQKIEIDELAKLYNVNKITIIDILHGRRSYLKQLR